MSNIDPREIDWTDSINPLLLNQYDEERRPSDYQMLQGPLWVALRKSATYEPYIQIAPEERNQQLAARGTFEGRFTVPHGSYLIGFSTSSQQPEGFVFNIADIGNGGAVFSKTIQSRLATAGTTQGVSNLFIPLQQPRPILSPGLLSANLTNRSGSANTVQLAVWFIVPEQSQDWTPAPNSYDDYLQRHTEQQRSITRAAWVMGSSGQLVPQADANAGIPPWEIMPANGRPMRFETIVPAPVMGTMDYPVVSFSVPAGYTAAIKRHRHAYIGAGFNEGSGELIWRISVDGINAPGYDNMTTTAQDEEIMGAILAQSGQLVEYTISVFGAALPDDILCGLRGFFYPQT